MVPLVRKHLLSARVKCSDTVNVRRRLLEIGAEPIGAYREVDTYFSVPRGWLKLTVVNGMKGRLVYCEREVADGLREVTMIIADVEKPGELAAVLRAALGIERVEDRVREVYRFGEVRIYVDRIKGRGEFLELEVEAGAEKGAKEAIEGIMRKLGVREESTE